QRRGLADGSDGGRMRGAGYIVARDARPGRALLLAVALLLLGAAPGSAVGGREGELWVAHYNGPGHGYDLAKALVVSPDGGTVFVTGWTNGPTSGLDYLTAAYDASTGVLRWGAPYNGLGNGTD